MYGYWQAALTTADTQASYEAKIATTTEPTGDGVISIHHYYGERGPENKPTLEFCLYGAGAENATGSGRWWGWRRDDYATLPLWVPTLLVETDGTFSTLVGIASAKVTNSMRFADTLVAGAGDPSSGAVYYQCATANTMIARCLYTLDGFEKIEFDGKKGTGTNVNSFYIVY